MADYKARVGNVELVSVTDGGMRRSVMDMFPDSDIERWRGDYPELLDTDDRFYLRFGSVVARSSGRVILVDTGMGGQGATLLDEMRRKGVDREAVDIVFITHLHTDHVGWNLSDGRPTFPNARYLVPRADWEYWTQPSVLERAAQVRDQVLPLDELRIMDLIDDEYEISDELTTVATPGHTPRHTSVLIVSAGQRGYVLGDVVHSEAQAHYTDWNLLADVDKPLARSTRNRVLERLEADGSLVSAGHFADPGLGRFVRRRGRRVWQGI